MQYAKSIVDDVFVTTWNCIDRIFVLSNGVAFMRYIGPPTPFGLGGSKWNE